MKKTKLEDIILYQDDDYLAINKPAGMSVLADRTGELGVLEWLREEYPKAQACHRLDKDTTGVLLFALNPEAYRHASIQFEKRLVAKTYLALVGGHAEFENFRDDNSITSDGSKSYLDSRGRDSITLFKTLEIFSEHTLVECRPETGRMHQIRVHLAGRGFPIVADDLYGGEPFYLSSIKKRYNLRKYAEEKPLLARLALHASELSFLNSQNKKIEIKADHYKDFEATLKQLRKNTR